MIAPHRFGLRRFARWTLSATARLAHVARNRDLLVRAVNPAGRDGAFVSTISVPKHNRHLRHRRSRFEALPPTVFHDAATQLANVVAHLYCDMSEKEWVALGEMDHHGFAPALPGIPIEAMVHMTQSSKPGRWIDIEFWQRGVRVAMTGGRLALPAAA